jgi:hypothetical protein
MEYQETATMKLKASSTKTIQHCIGIWCLSFSTITTTYIFLMFTLHTALASSTTV